MHSVQMPGAFFYLTLSFMLPAFAARIGEKSFFGY